MKQTTVFIPYAEAKIEAIRHFTDGGKPSLEDEMTALTDRLYVRTVPAPVREFIAAQEKNASPDGEVRRKKRPVPAPETPDTAEKPIDAARIPKGGV